jgi:hypothetical protein
MAVELSRFFIGKRERTARPEAARRNDEAAEGHAQIKFLKYKRCKNSKATKKYSILCGFD